MEFGIGIATSSESWKLAQRAEELGFSHAWFYDTQMITADCFVAMGAAAMKTSRIHLGTGVFLNFNCVLLDVNTIEIGDRTQIGPAVQIYAADHPRNPEARLANLECGKPVRIGRNVWIGGGAIILPGITIGDDAIIGAGSVVTHDIPSGVTVIGNPARKKETPAR